MKTPRVAAVSLARRTCAWLGLCLPLLTAPGPVSAAEPVVRRIAYDARLSESGVRVTADIDLEWNSRGPGSVRLLEGEVAPLPNTLPSGLELRRAGQSYDLVVSRAGAHRCQVHFVVRTFRNDPWNECRFKGPAAGIATVVAHAEHGSPRIELLTGTPVDPTTAGGNPEAVLGAEREVALRWRSQAAEGTRQLVVTCDTVATLRATPSVLQYVTELRYQIPQGNAGSFAVALPQPHALTRVEGEQIRDWQVVTEAERTILKVQLVRPAEGAYTLRVLSEQPVDAVPFAGEVQFPEPQDLDRETGLVTVQVQDVRLSVEPLAGMRQVSATPEATAAYRFHGRPARLALRLDRLEPVVRLGDRMHVRLEDHRLLQEHRLELAVEQAGLYALGLGPLHGATVTDVESEGLESWDVLEDRLRLNFSSRVIGTRTIRVRAETPYREFPSRLELFPLHATGAESLGAQVGATAAPGIQLKTEALDGAREIPVSQLASREEAGLAYQALQRDWSVRLAAERLAPRVVANAFSLITVGDGVVGGSATLRYAILNQGVQEFRLRIPSAWRNVEFTGLNIRRRDQQGEVWTITLQEKVWGGYTLVVTYDQPFDPHQAVLQLGGLQALEVERETGSLAVTSAGGLQLRETHVPQGLERIDETELEAADRALITRSVLLAYRYADSAAATLSLDARRFESASVLAAVADRTQLTTVVTEDGQMLTQATFLVKNHDKQFQTFTLPAAAQLWSAFVNGQPVKAEQQNQTLLVPLPRGADRDQAFAVELVYAQQGISLREWRPRNLVLAAPATDVQTTYAEWELYLPMRNVLKGLGGNMRPVRGTTYGWADAWLEVTTFYHELVRDHLGLLLLGLALMGLAALITAAVRRGVQGVLTFAGVMTVLVVLAGMLLPSLAKAKAKAQRISAVNNLKQIGLAARVYSTDNGGRMPASFEEMRQELGTDKVTIDPQTGRRFIFLGGLVSETTPDAVLAYSPEAVGGGRAVLLADGSVQQVTEERFTEYLKKTALLAQGATQAPSSASPAALLASAGIGGPAATTALQLPTAIGLRPLRIELPRAGRRFVFTKVLNVQREALALEAWAVRARLWNGMRGGLQASAFLLGLAWVGWEWRRRNARSLSVTLGILLVLGSLTSLLLSYRWLGAAWIVLAPALTVTGIVYVFRRCRARTRVPQSVNEDQGSLASAPTSAATLALVLALAGGSVGGARADQTQANPAVTPQVEILSADYAGVVGDRVAEIEAIFRVRAPEGGGLIRLFGNDVAVRDFESSPRGARLVRQPDGVAVHLPRAGETRLRLRSVVKTGGEIPRRQLLFGIPAAWVSRVTVTLNEPDATVVCPAAVTCATQAAGSQTRVEALLGAAERLELTWTPRVKRVTEIDTTVFCRNAARVLLAAGVATCRAQLEYQVTQGELKELRVRIPAGHRVLRVEGDQLQTWQLEEPPGTEAGSGDGGALLRVQLLRGISPGCRLAVETEWSLPQLPATAPVEIPHAIGVKRETGWVAIQGGEELGLTVEAQEGLQKGDPADFLQILPESGSIHSAFQFLRPDFCLRVRAETLQPQVDATAFHLFRVDLDELRLESTLTYVIRHAGLFTLRLEIPEGYRIDRIEAPLSGVAFTNTSGATGGIRWTERREGQRRLVEVQLPSRVLGPFTLSTQPARAIRELPPEVEVPGVLPLDAAKVTGHVLVAAEAGVQVKTEVATGLTEIPASAVPGGRSGLAFKLPAGEPGMAWQLRVSPQRLESWVRAEVVTWLTLGEGLANGRTMVRYDVQNAPAREFRLRIPEGFRNVEIHAPNLRRRDREGTEWRLELQHRISGPLLVTVTWDQAFSLASGGRESPLTLEAIEALGVERETGFVAVGARTQMELTAPAAGAELLRVDTQDLPEWAGSPEAPIALAYRYLRPGYALTVVARRFDPAAVLQALVDEARLTTVVAEDGQMMTELTFNIRNNGRQFLEIQLPTGAEVWSAFVNAQPVRPGIRDGQLLLPLERSSGDTGTTSVQLIYVGAGGFPRGTGRVSLVSPAVDLPIKNARWELYLPPDFEYDRFGGTMNHESEAARLVGAFSLDEYSQAESVKRREQRQQVSNSILDVKSKLAKGELEGANKAYGQMARRYGLSEGQSALKELEQELRRAQTGNLKRAQDLLVMNNSLTVPAGQPAATTAEDNYDQQVAEQQIARVQQAQEVLGVTARPLRVNLPTRGLRYTFTQALQMKGGEALRVEFTAANLRAAHWPCRIACFLLGSLAVWAFVAAVLRERARSLPPAPTPATAQA